MFYLLLLIFAFGQISFGSRIIGGQYAAAGQFPHQISLQLRGRHHCGGAIISSLWIVTAAHCTAGQHPATMRVIAGTVDLTRGGRSYEIQQFVQHPQHNPRTWDYDLSLIRVRQYMALDGTYMRSITLAASNENYAANTLATVSGFGAINSNHVMPNRLIYANLPLWGRDRCNSRNIPRITDRMICAGYSSGQVNSCAGDSGGALTVNNRVFGIVSWGFGCGTRGYPSVYTYIGGLRGWIRQVTGV